MIEGIGYSPGGKNEAPRPRAVRPGTAVGPVTAAVGEVTAPVQTAAGEIAARGAPVDAAKVAAIRNSIAEGRYPVDAQKIAEKMIELDLGPARG